MKITFTKHERRFARTWGPLLLGLGLGVGGMLAPYLKARADATKWAELQGKTRDSWVEDRENWRNGKPFEPHYNRHHHAW